MVDNSDGTIVAQVNVKFKESINGNTSDYWNYSYTLQYILGGLYTLNVAYNCAVNETGQADDYCNQITYPNGQQDTDVTAPYTAEVHDLATGNTVNNGVTGFFGLHSTPPPSGSDQVKKYAQLTESAFFSSFNVTDIARIRTFDVCIPNKSSFSGVTLCTSSGTGR